MIGLVVQNDIAGVYLCDGKDVAEWFGGEVKNSKLDLTTPAKTHFVAIIGDTITVK